MILREDGISVRNSKEQEEYVNSPEYQEALNYLENKDKNTQIKREKKKRYMKKYNYKRYRLENKIRELTLIDGDVSSNFQPIRNDHIPKIILTKIGNIILKHNEWIF